MTGRSLSSRIGGILRSRIGSLIEFSNLEIGSDQTCNSIGKALDIANPRILKTKCTKLQFGVVELILSGSGKA